MLISLLHRRGTRQLNPKTARFFTDFSVVIVLSLKHITGVLMGILQVHPPTVTSINALCYCFTKFKDC